MNERVKDLRKKLIKKAKKQVQEKYEGKEGHIIRGISVVQDLDASFNLLAEHCIEWYGMHFPELQRLVKDNRAFLKLVYFIGDKSKFSEKTIGDNTELKNAKTIVEKAKKSMGSSIDDSSLKELQLLALNALNLREERDFLMKFIDIEMSAIAANFSKIAGSMLAAKLLAEAGSLRRLAMAPSSTIQMLGAEKALFRHLKNRAAKPPKHGFILMHPFVQKVPRKNKGKMARALAGKLSIAVKEDYFGKKDISKELQTSLENRFEQLKS
tara:strand:- start:264 stop:1067 length:804 start_codon:yes stop_codon:yes gene_type:complete